jgi:hypothetical protein
MGKPYSTDLRERAVAVRVAFRGIARRPNSGLGGEQGRQLGPAVSGHGQCSAGRDGRA